MFYIYVCYLLIFILYLYLLLSIYIIYLTHVVKRLENVPFRLLPSANDLMVTHALGHLMYWSSILLMNYAHPTSIVLNTLCHQSRLSSFIICLIYFYIYIIIYIIIYIASFICFMHRLTVDSNCFDFWELMIKYFDEVPKNLSPR